MAAEISPDALEFLIQNAGLTLTEAQKAEMLTVYTQVRAMADRVRQPRGRQAEPAHIFVPGA